MSGAGKGTPGTPLDFALGAACLRAYIEREGHADVPLDHVEPITPDVLRKAADELERDAAQARAR